MKAIFLDIDGIIATPTSVRLNYLLGRNPTNQFYDAVSLTYLGKLVAQSGARVVLSSNWRDGARIDDPFTQAIMQNLYEQLAQAGAPVFDMTPRLDSYDRSEEIGAWLDAHPCEAWVILDDLAPFELRPEVSEGHLVLVEDSEGLRWRHYQQARVILGI